MIKGCIRGDTRMQKEFYYLFFPVLMRVCIRYTDQRENAEQWVHDAFLKIFDSLRQYNFEGSFEGWIKKIASRVCIDHIRRSKGLKFEIERNTLPVTEYEERDIQIENEALSRISTENVLSILGKLPEKQRLVFNLSVFEAYSHKEIAVLLGINENYSYWLLHQAKKELQDIFKNYHIKEVHNEAK